MPVDIPILKIFCQNIFRKYNSTDFIEEYMEDCDCYTEKDIVGITADGIALKNKRFINFRECAACFRRLQGGSGACVAERDAGESNWVFIFYTEPRATRIDYFSQVRRKEFFSRKNTARRFYGMQKQIEAFGFTTYDRS